MSFFAFIFWPLDRFSTWLERRWWLEECSRFDELRGFAMEDLKDEEAERWAIDTKRAPVVS